MSEPAAKQRSPIDLDEFERRLRGTTPALPPVIPQEDPLAELARLVGNADRFRAPAVRLPRPARPSLVPAPARRIDPPQRIEEPQAAAFDFDASRGALHQNHEEYTAEEPPYEEENYFEQNDIDDERQPRSRRASLLMGGSLALVLAGIAVTFAMKAHAPAGGDAPTIKAAAGPIKVQPTNQNNVDLADRNASLLDRSSGDRLASSKVVNSEEQPVDLQAIRLQRSAVGQSPAAGAPAAGSAASMSANGAGGYFPTPIRVRTVSVRADGSVIGDGYPSPPAPSAAGTAPATLMTSSVPPSAQPAASIATPANLMAADTSLRRPTTPKNTTTPKAIAVTAKPADYKADAAPLPASDAPIVLRSAPAKPARVASIEPRDLAKAAPVSASAGNYSVQLAALGSEAEANGTLNGFQKKFPTELRGRHLAVEKGDNHGRTVFRVRVVGLASDDANVLCSEIKAGGKSCFVKRD
jgi:hypothetical protein